MANQWAPGHDNEAGYVAILANTASQSTAMISPIRYPEYVATGARTVKGKGDPVVDIDMQNVPFADYTTMRETDLGFTSSESDIAKEITIQLDEPDQTTANNWNAVVIHRPGEDTVLSVDGRYYETVHWTVIIVGAT